MARITIKGYVTCPQPNNDAAFLAISFLVEFEDNRVCCQISLTFSSAVFVPLQYQKTVYSLLLPSFVLLTTLWTRLPAGFLWSQLVRGCSIGRDIYSSGILLLSILLEATPPLRKVG